MTTVEAAPIPVVSRVRPTARDPRSKRWRWMLPALSAVVLLLIVANVLWGIGNMLTPEEAWWALLGYDVPLTDVIAVDTRLPRALLAALAGASLGVSGALMQALTRNPLASPELTGVSAGAVAAVLALLAFGPSLGSSGEWVTPLVAVLGGLAAAAIVYLLSRRLGSIETTRFILIGVLVGGVLTSVSTISLIFLGTDASRVLAWLAGSLALKTDTDLLMAVAYVLPGILLLFFVIPRANLLHLGDEVARGLGQRRDFDRLLVVLCSVFLAAGTVAIVGAIGFVGLLGPHMVRPLVGSDLRRLVPATALSGAAMVLTADLLARNIDARTLMGPLGDEVFTGVLPVGVYLELFGVPFLIAMLLQKRSGR